MTTTIGPTAVDWYVDLPPGSVVLPLSVGDAISLPMTLTQKAVLADDGVTVITPQRPVDMTGMTPSAEFLGIGQTPGQGTALTISNFVPAAGSWLASGPGRGQPGDLTSGLPEGPARLGGPCIRVRYTDSVGSHTFGTFYLAVS